MLPSLHALQIVHDALAAANITAALGGSGLLHGLGLVDQVRDWDLTTDAPLEAVTAALGALAWSHAPCGDPPFGSLFRLGIMVEGATVDLMGSFAIAADDAVCRIPTIVAGTWKGIPLGSPEAWTVAYRLMGRHGRADTLSHYLMRQGGHKEIVERLLAEPLPDNLRREVQAWPVRGM